jgi:inosine/xanthosine triphosphatase
VRVVVASGNPVKVAAARDAFEEYFGRVEVEALEVDSEVPDQPIGAQTLQGARNRARAAWRALAAAGDRTDVDYCVGVEGGIVRVEDRWFAMGWMCVADAEGRESFGASPWFELPATVIEELLEGTELGIVMDRITGLSDTKKKGGAIGHFTRGVVDRRELYAAGLRVALVPVLNREVFSPGAVS